VRFKDRIAIVTGAAGSIGAELVRAFLMEGATVFGWDTRSADLSGFPGCSLRVVDVRDAAHVARAVSDLNGAKVDVLVNGAALLGSTANTWDIDVDEWRDILDVNLSGAFICCRAVLPRMMERGCGAIVNLASIAARQAYRQRCAYAASKWGMLGLTRTLAAEAGAYGIRVNAVCPGPVEGERMARVMAQKAEASARSPADVRAEYETNTALGRLVDVRSVVETVLFLASDGATSVSGAAWEVDCGYRL